MNSKEQVLIRKYNKNLEVSGMAIMLFGLWSMIKLLATFLIKDSPLRDVAGMTMQEIKDYRLAMISIVIIILAVTMLFHLYLGSSAIRYSRGTKKHAFFLFFIVMYLLGTIWSITSYDIKSVQLKDIDSFIASVILDVTVCVALLDILFSVFRVKQLKKKLEREE